MRRRLLILEDDATLRKNLVRLLTRRGFEVDASDSVAAFLRAAGGGSYDVCLLDLSLPDGDGLAAWAAVRPTQPGAIAVLMTAYGGSDVESEVVRLGIRALLSKPLDVPALLDAVAA